MRHYWIPVLLIEELPANDCRPVRVKLLSERLLAWRDTQGRYALHDEFCAHRGVSLWFGRNEENGLRCAYHGWRFDACSGQCVEIPSLTSQDKLRVDRIFAGHYPCEEHDGYVWVYMHAPGSRLGETVPAAPKLATFSAKYKITHLACDLPAHVDHGIIGLMDPAHGPFVHQSWFWRSRGSIHEKQAR